MRSVRDLGIDGLVASSEDIAERLNELSANRELARTMGAAARMTAVAYSWEAMAERYLSLYSELAGLHNGAA